MVGFHSETSLEKTNFSLTSAYQLENASGLGMGACFHSSFQLQWYRRGGGGQVLCLLPQSLGESLCAYPAVERRSWFLGVFRPLPSNSCSSTSSLRSSLSLDGGISFRAEHPKVSHSAYCVTWGSVFVPTCCRRKHLCWWLSKAWI